jgi:hypothetical protein
MERRSERSSHADANSHSYAHVVLHFLRRSFRPALLVGFPEGY